MPELPEVEAWARALGPTHIATVKTFDPALASLEGRRRAGTDRGRQEEACGCLASQAGRTRSRTRPPGAGCPASRAGATRQAPWPRATTIARCRSAVPRKTAPSSSRQGRAGTEAARPPTGCSRRSARSAGSREPARRSRSPPTRRAQSRESAQCQARRTAWRFRSSGRARRLPEMCPLRSFSLTVWSGARCGSLRLYVTRK